MQPRVSVVIPVRNGERYLVASLESVFEQVCDFEFEVILINDNSTDNTLNLAKRFLSQNLIILDSPGNGISDALNFGVSRSKGEFIARHDADDIMVAGRLQIQFDFLKVHQDFVVVGGQITIISELPQRFLPNVYPCSPEELANSLAKGCYIAHPTALIRKESFQAVGGYRPSFDGAEDYDLWLRLTKIGKLTNLNSVVTEYRTHNQQVTQSKWHITHLQTAKVRLSWVFDTSNIFGFRRKNETGMYISRTLMLKHLWIETLCFLRVQVSRLKVKWLHLR